jgi:carbon-monoxide dehydrogenase medium subunit
MAFSENKLEYLFPRSVEEALAMLETGDGRARVVAGGTDVMPELRAAKIAPRVLLDITRIPGLSAIEVAGDFVRVGAAVTFAAIKASPFFNRHVHALVDAAASVGAAGIQNAATWAGNIVQAMPAADGAVVAVALEAEARIVDGEGIRWRPVETLFEGPGVSAVDPTRQIVTHLRFPRPRPGWGSAWRRVGRRPSLVLPILNCAATLQLGPAGRIERALLALGPVAPRPFRARSAEAFLLGRPPTPETFEEAARIAQREANPRSSVMRASREYRLAILPAMVSEALALAARRAASGC